MKSTRRVTKPHLDISESITLTRNEWLAAKQHQDNFAIYRIYLTRDGVFLFVLKNPAHAWDTGEIFAEPTHVRVDFKGIAGKMIKID